MTIAGTMRGRSTPEWGVRILLAVLAAGVGYASLSQTLGYALRRSNVMQAHNIAPADGRITALAAAALSEPSASTADRVRANELARLALRQDPTAVGAATALGVNADIQGDTAVSRHFFTYAQKLSRREITPQLWAIETAVASNDIPTVLRHYDIALRTSKLAPELLFPVLASASSDAAIRAELVRTLASKPAWSSGFVDYLSMNASNPLASADLLQRLSRTGFAVSAGARSAVLKALLANNRSNEAWAYYTSFRPEIDRRRSRDERFTLNDAPTPFDWNIRQDTVNASIQRNESGGVFDYTAPAGVGGVALEQMQFLPAGTYRLDGHSLDIGQQIGSGPYWSLRCIGGNEVGRIETPPSDQAGGTFSGMFTVPAGCSVQVLQLTVRPTDAVIGTSGQIDRVRLFPVIR